MASFWHIQIASPTSPVLWPLLNKEYLNTHTVLYCKTVQEEFFFHFCRNGMLFIIYEFFISGIFHSVSSNSN